MKTTWSSQYTCPAVIVEDGDEADPDAVIAFCREKYATYDEGDEDLCLVAVLRPDIGPELWTERSLRGSLVSRAKKKATQK